MHTVEITLEQVLLARDRRVLRQRALAARYGGTLLSFTTVSYTHLTLPTT